jgi:hypothetical protein
MSTRVRKKEILSDDFKKRKVFWKNIAEHFPYGKIFYGKFSTSHHLISQKTLIFSCNLSCLSVEERVSLRWELSLIKSETSSEQNKFLEVVKFVTRFPHIMLLSKRHDYR